MATYTPPERTLSRRAREYNLRQPAPDLDDFEHQLTGRTPGRTTPPEFQRSFFEQPVENLRRGLDYAGQDISQHFGKPFSEAAGGIAGSIVNRGLDILSFIPREVSPVAVGYGRAALEGRPSPADVTEAKREGEQFRELVGEKLAVPDFDIGPLQIRLGKVPAEFLYDVLTDPTSWLFGVGTALKASKLAGIAKAGSAMEVAAMAPALPIMIPFKILDGVLGATGMKALTNRGKFNGYMRTADLALTELRMYGDDLEPLLKAPAEPLSRQTIDFITEHKPAIDKWLKKANLADPFTAEQELLTTLAAAKRKELGLGAPRGFGSLYANYVNLLKNAWLGVNPAYPLANFVDALPKAIVHANLRHVLDSPAIVERLALGEAGQRIGGYSTQTVGEFAERKPFGTAAWAESIERFTRQAVYVPELANQVNPRLSAFLQRIEPEILATGADPAAVRSALNSLRISKHFNAKDFIAAINNAPQLAVNAGILDDLARRVPAGMADVAKVMVDDITALGGKATPAQMQVIKKKAIKTLEDRFADTDALLKFYRQQEVAEANAIYAKLAQQLLHSISVAPSETAAMQTIAALYQIIELHGAAANMARVIGGRGKREAVVGWRHFKDVIQAIADSVEEVAPQLADDVKGLPLGSFGDDLRQLVATYQRELDLATDAMKKRMASVEKGGENWVWADARQERDGRMARLVEQGFNSIVKKHQPLLKEYSTLERTVGGAPLKQFREQIETLMRKRVNEVDTFVDEMDNLDTMKAIINDVEERVIAPAPVATATDAAAGRVLPIFSASEYDRTVKQFAGELSGLIREAHDEAAKLTDHAMFNYGDETRLDALLRKMSPFVVWQMRNIPFWIQEIAQYPVGRNVARQLDDYLGRSKQEQEQRNLTGRMERTSKLGEIDVGTGTMELRAEPYAPFLSAAQQMTDPFVLTGDDDELGPQGATQFGGFLQTLLRFAGGISLYPHIYLPLQLAGAFGETPVQDILPTSRAVRGVGELTGLDTSALDFERNLTQPLLRRAGESIAEGNIPGVPGVRQTAMSGDIFRDENIRRRITEIGRREDTEVATMLRAMNDPESALWQRARREVEREANLQGFARLLAPITVKTLSKGEAQLREAKADLPAYNPDRESEDFKLRNQMLQADPGLAAYLDRFDHPAAKQISAEISEYYSLGDEAARKRIDATPTEQRKALYQSDPKAAEVSKLRQAYIKEHPALDGYFGRDREATPTMREYVASIVNQPEVEAQVAEQVGKYEKGTQPGVVRAQGEIKAVEEAGVPTGAEADLSALLEQYADLKAPRYDEYYDYSTDQRTAFRQKAPQDYAAIRDSAAARRELVLENDILAQWYAFRDREKWKEGGEERFLKALADGLVESPTKAKAYIKGLNTTTNLQRPAQKQPYRIEPVLARASKERR